MENWVFIWAVAVGMLQCKKEYSHKYREIETVEYGIAEKKDEIYTWENNGRKRRIEKKSEWTSHKNEKLRSIKTIWWNQEEICCAQQ